ncbi:MAG: hypothetical protein O3B31_15255 [Chloroflexi bacterium]|nr:hypothetical protein [Chloroflexota bacterium]MDA1004680.1 hypothetical protein [Chloroflexota bacterium]
MGLLSAIFGGDRDGSLDCPHARLIPRWRGPQVMDDDAQAMGFVCQDCGREFLNYRVHDRRLRTR